MRPLGEEHLPKIANALYGMLCENPATAFQSPALAQWLADESPNVAQSASGPSADEPESGSFPAGPVNRVLCGAPGAAGRARRFPQGEESSLFCIQRYYRCRGTGSQMMGDESSSSSSFSQEVRGRRDWIIG